MFTVYYLYTYSTCIHVSAKLKGCLYMYTCIHVYIPGCAVLFSQQNVLKQKKHGFTCTCACAPAPPPPPPTCIQRKWSMDGVMYHVTKIVTERTVAFFKIAVSWLSNACDTYTLIVLCKDACNTRHKISEHTCTRFFWGVEHRECQPDA